MSVRCGSAKQHRVSCACRFVISELKINTAQSKSIVVRAVRSTVPAAGAPDSHLRPLLLVFRLGESSDDPNESDLRILRPADRAGLLMIAAAAAAERGLLGTFAFFSADAARGVSVEMIMPLRSKAWRDAAGAGDPVGLTPSSGERLAELSSSSIAGPVALA